LCYAIFFLIKGDDPTAIAERIRQKEQVVALCRALEKSGFSAMAKVLIMDMESVDDRDTIDHISGCSIPDVIY
jgi:hypothetical protein